MSLVIRRKDQLFAKLRLLKPKVTRELATAAFKAGEEVATLARQFVPVDDGKLRDSIKVVVPPDQFNPKVRVEAGGSEAYYARWVEFGTAARGEHPGTPAQPYLFPAYRLMRKKIKGRFSRAMTKAAKEVASG